MFDWKNFPCKFFQFKWFWCVPVLAVFFLYYNINFLKSQAAEFTTAGKAI